MLNKQSGVRGTAEGRALLRLCFAASRLPEGVDAVKVLELIPELLSACDAESDAGDSRIDIERVTGLLRGGL
jgi:hypothetical protein